MAQKTEVSSGYPLLPSIGFHSTQAVGSLSRTAATKRSKLMFRNECESGVHLFVVRTLFFRALKRNYEPSQWALLVGCLNPCRNFGGQVDRNTRGPVE
jgi:hypothetical protein